MTREQNLKEKLGLSDNSKLEFEQFKGHTRNPNYIILVDGIPSYFMKVNPAASLKEKKIYEFLDLHPLVNTIKPLYIDETIIVTPFIPNLSNVEVRDCFDLILDFHKKSLNLETKLYDFFSSDKDFKNIYVAKFVNRLGRHEDLVFNFWPNIKQLVKFSERHPSEIFLELPKIMNHGDLRFKNIQKDDEGNIYIIDFEDSYYDSSSWDLSRALMDLESNEIAPFINRYVKEIPIQNKELLKKSIHRDFVIRVITDSIGRQQREGIDGAKPYLQMYSERYKAKLMEILKDD